MSFFSSRVLFQNYSLAIRTDFHTHDSCPCAKITGGECEGDGVCHKMTNQRGEVQRHARTKKTSKCELSNTIEIMIFIITFF